MNTRLAMSSIAAAAIIPAVLANSSANADDGTPTPTVDTGQHGYESVTEITPSLEAEYPGIGSLTEQFTDDELQRGEGDLATDSQPAAEVDE